MKILNGKDLADFIKERQVRQVRSLKQAHGVSPKLAIVQVTDNPVINTYVGLKKRYGADIMVEVESHSVDQADVSNLIDRLNGDDDVHGIIVQLPLEDVSETDKVLNLLDPAKDVDGLSEAATYDPATPTAIKWLLDGYNIELKDKQIAVVGNGRLVGAPLVAMLQRDGYSVAVYDKSAEDLSAGLLSADVVISATGKAGLIEAQVVKHGAVAVDAGVAVESGKTTGDFADDMYERDDLSITPKKGGVGPLTVSALFENVIRVAQSKAS